MTQSSRRPALFALTFLLPLVLGAPTAARAAVGQPIEIIDRPRTLPGGELELRGGVDLARSSYTDATGTHSETSLSAPLDLGYGVSDQLDLYVFYALGLHPTVTGKTPVEIRLAFTFFRDRRLSAAGQVRSGVDLGSHDVTPLVLGVNALYKVAGAFAVFTPGEQLRVGLAGSNRPIGLDLPVGFGLQVTPQVFGSLTTNLAHIGIANDSDSFILADMLPANLALFYSFSSRLDVGAHLDIDLQHTNHVAVGALVRAFM